MLLDAPQRARCGGSRRSSIAQPTHVAWTPDSRALLFTLEDRGRVGLCAPRRSTRPLRRARGRPRRHRSAASRSRATAACSPSTARSSTHPPALFACRGDGSGERAIETLNRALLARHALGEVREVTIKGWGGEPVQMWITYPPNFDPKKKWPLLHSIHGGPHAAHHDGWHFRWNTQVFAGHGYVVAAVNYHGSSGFGQKWLETITGRYGEKEFADIEAGHRLAAAPGLHRSLAARRDRRQLRRLHGRLHERPHRPLPHVSSATPAATTGSA